MIIPAERLQFLDDNSTQTEGSILMCTETYYNQFTKEKLYVGTDSRCMVIRDDDGLTNGWSSSAMGSKFKLVKTKPFEEAKIGDTIISLTTRDRLREVNDIFTIKSFPGSSLKGYYYGDSWGDNKEFAVLDLLPEEPILDLSAVQM